MGSSLTIALRLSLAVGAGALAATSAPASTVAPIAGTVNSYASNTYFTDLDSAAVFDDEAHDAWLAVPTDLSATAVKTTFLGAVDILGVSETVAANWFGADSGTIAVNNQAISTIGDNDDLLQSMGSFSLWSYRFRATVDSVFTLSFDDRESSTVGSGTALGGNPLYALRINGVPASAPNLFTVSEFALMAGHEYVFAFGSLVTVEPISGSSVTNTNDLLSWTITPGTLDTGGDPTGPGNGGGSAALEPGACLLMVVGFGSLGATLRGRRGIAA